MELKTLQEQYTIILNEMSYKETYVDLFVVLLETELNLKHQYGK